MAKLYEIIVSEPQSCRVFLFCTIGSSSSCVISCLYRTNGTIKIKDATIKIQYTDPISWNPAKGEFFCRFMPWSTARACLYMSFSFRTYYEMAIKGSSEADLEPMSDCCLLFITQFLLPRGGGWRRIYVCVSM